MYLETLRSRIDTHAKDTTVHVTADEKSLWNSLASLFELVDIGTEENTTEITVENVRLVSMSEQTIVYITATDGNVYKGYLESDESLILIRVGDKLRLSYAPGEHESIFIILSWEKAQPAEGS